MKLIDLRHFVLHARQHQGVNWFLTDRTPSLKHPNQVFGLYCYDAEDNPVHEVDFIEERLGQKIPKSKLELIADARLKCGMNSAYLRRRDDSAMDSQSKEDFFDLHQKQWAHSGRFQFIKR